MTTFPGNTVVVTSRIVGYENPFRFDEKEFVHYRVAQLQMPEINRFVEDWYAAPYRDDGRGWRSKSAIKRVSL